MGFFASLVASAGFGPKRDALDNRWYGPADSVVTQSGVAVTRESALELDTVQSILEVLGGAASTIPLMVLKRDGDNKEPDREHRLYRILHDRPNASQTSQEFRDELTRHLAFDRNAYCRILSESDQAVSGLEIIHPTRVAKVERREGRVFYTINPLDSTERAGRIEVLRDDQIWHIRKAPLTVDGLKGIPVWQTGREAMGRALAVERYGARWFRNSGQSGGVIKHPKRFINKDEKDAFLAAWRSGRTGENQHSDRILYDGLDYTPNVVQNDQAQFIETLKQVEVKIARLWQMPPHRIGILDRATFSNIEAQGLDFVVYALAPWIAAIEQAANRDLLTEDEQKTHFVEFNVAGLLRGDIMSRYKSYALGRQWGWLSVNDIKRRENEKTIGPDGDVYLEPLNMVPAGRGDAADNQNDDLKDSPDEP